jgi:two-component system, response regulator RegA
MALTNSCNGGAKKLASPPHSVVLTVPLDSTLTFKWQWPSPRGMMATETTGAEGANPDLPEDKTLLIVDDDRAFLQRLARAMEARGFEVEAAASVQEGLVLLRQRPPAFAVVDMRLDDGNGLDVIAVLKELRPEARAVVLTGYGNIATAVTAVKIGAVDYLAKPADADDVYHALIAQDDSKAPPPENPMSADRVRWEHIQRVYELCNRNVSETARRLNMHRRTLQRILAKRAPK